MPIKTLLTEKLGIEHPVIQGGMQYVGYAEMAAAVSNAGGLGILTGLTQPSPDDLRNEIRRCRSMTSKPFGVNLTILPALIPADYDQFVNVICKEKPALIEISGGSPRKYMKQLKEAGIVVLHKSATIKHALKAEKDGVDFVEIAGFESSIAGRSSEDDVTTWILIAKAARVLKVPFLVSGASATGRQLAAALAMGAQGITMGTRFLCTKECPIHENIKKKLADISTDEFATTLVLRSFNNSTRVLKNDVTAEILRIESSSKADFSQVAALASGQRAKTMFQETGDWNNAMWSTGASVALIDGDISSCKDLIEGIVAEAEERIAASAKLVHSKI